MKQPGTFPPLAQVELLIFLVVIQIVSIAPQGIIFYEAKGKRNRTEQTFVPCLLPREDRFYLFGFHDTEVYQDFADALRHNR